MSSKNQVIQLNLIFLRFSSVFLLWILLIFSVIENVEENGVKILYMLLSVQAEFIRTGIHKDFCDIFKPKAQIIKSDFPIVYSCVINAQSQINQETVLVINVSFIDHLAGLKK